MIIEPRFVCDVCRKEGVAEGNFNRVRIQVNSLSRELELFRAGVTDAHRQMLMGQHQWKSKDMLVCNDCFLPEPEIAHDVFGNVPVPKAPSSIKKFLAAAFRVVSGPAVRT